MASVPPITPPRTFATVVCCCNQCTASSIFSISFSIIGMSASPIFVPRFSISAFVAAIFPANVPAAVVAWPAIRSCRAFSTPLEAFWMSLSFDCEALTASTAVRYLSCAFDAGSAAFGNAFRMSLTFFCAVSSPCWACCSFNAPPAVIGRSIPSCFSGRRLPSIAFDKARAESASGMFLNFAMSAASPSCFNPTAGSFSEMVNCASAASVSPWVKPNFSICLPAASMGFLNSSKFKPLAFSAASSFAWDTSNLSAISSENPPTETRDVPRPNSAALP